MQYSVIIPNKYESVIDVLLASIKKFESNSHIVIVSDNHDRDYGFDHIRVNGNFLFSKSVNAGIDYAGRDDVILMNDDTMLLQCTFKKLHDIAYSDPSIGILVPMIDGGCASLYQQSHRKSFWKRRSIRYNDRISLTCAYIKRELLNRIGNLRTQQIAYGLDDDDLKARTIKAGYKVAITNYVTVLHGIGGNKLIRGQNWNTSYVRKNESVPLAEMLDKSGEGLLYQLNRTHSGRSN